MSEAFPSTAPSPAPSSEASTTVACPVTDVAALSFVGADAQSFLQGQLSSDVAALGVGDAQWSSYNSPKGRMLASLLLWREDDHSYRVLLAADLAAATARRLRMFVLRAKVTIEEQADAAVRGVAGAAAGEALAHALAHAPRPGGATRHGDVSVVGTPDGRFLVLGAPPRLADVTARLPASVTHADAATWAYRRIAAGVPLVTAATADQFVPQTVNWDALGGISFRKGCYPGQEIVARTHYLGRLKERLHPFHLATGAAAGASGPGAAAAASTSVPASPGTRLYSSTFGDQACGTVVNAAPDPAGGTALLAVVQTAAADPLHLGAPEGAALSRRTLPYPLPEPAPPRGRMA